jgi:4-hydroxybenzoate polyprenyltransferase
MATQTSTFPHIGRRLALAQLVRLPNVFTAWADIFLAGVVIGVWPELILPFLFLLLASTFLYWAGMVWNDYFDVEQDRRERPFRPLPSGKISLSTAAALGIGLMAAGLACATAPGPEGLQLGSFILASFLAVTILLYDAWLKRTWAGPIAMGSCRFLNVLLGLSLAPAGIEGWGILLALVVGTYIAGVTWFARKEAGASNPTFLLAAAGVTLAGLLLSLAIPGAADASGLLHSTSPLFPYLVVALGFYVGFPMARAIEKPGPGRVQAAVKRAVLSLILLDAVLATALAGTLGILLALLLIPALYLGKWVYST